MTVRRWPSLAAALWLGILLAVALIATPSAFAVLPVADAGRVAGRVLQLEAGTSLAFGIVLLMWTRREARAAADAEGGSQFSAAMLLCVGALLCTVIGYYGLQPMMAEARAGRGAFGFGQLHAASLVLFLVKVVLVAALGWTTSAFRAQPQ